MADQYEDLNLHKIQMSEIIGDSIGYINENSTAIEETINPIADAIVDSYIDGIWTVRKYESGVMECWGKTPDTQYSITTPRGALFTADVGNVNFPAGFITVPLCFVQALANAGPMMSALTGGTLTTTKTGVTLLGTGSGNATASVFLRVIGKYK